MTGKTLDCSDLDNYMGKPMTPWSLRESLHNSDFRRWAQAMHYPNLLHYDSDYAAVSRFGRLVAPQSFTIAAAEGHGACPAGIGRIPNSHLIFGGDEWWFHGPRFFAGDRVIHDKIPFDYVVKDTKFAGPTCFQRDDNNYYKQDGQLFARQRSTSIRYRPDMAVEMAAMTETEDPQWTDEKLADNDCDPVKLGFVGEMAGYEMNAAMEKRNPELTDGAYVGPSRGHLVPRWARFIGMRRRYGYGASMGA